MRDYSFLTVAACLAAALMLAPRSSQAQVPPQQGWPPVLPQQQQGYPPYTYPQQQGYPPAGYGYTQPTPTTSSSGADDVERGVLLGTSAAYGVGLGIWLDAETGLDDPGLKFIPPVALGVAAPAAMFLADQNSPMPKGMPAAISAGLMIGAGEGLGIWSYQYTVTKDRDSWGFRGLSRSMTIGSTLGGVGGFALGYYQEPSPRSTAFIGSGVLWGTVVGSMIGYGSTKGGTSFGQSNEGASLGGLIGYNLGLGAAAAVTASYVPSWEQMMWMWAGGGIGAAAGLPIYLAYAGSDKPAKRGLIFQGITTSLGIAAGGIFSSQLTANTGYTAKTEVVDPNKPRYAELTGLGLMPVENGAGVQMMGLLY